MPEPIQTNDELTDKITAALEAEPDIETPAEPVEQTQVETTTENLSEVVEPPAEPAAPTEQTSPETTPPAPVDYKEKFVESSKESILNHERAKVANAQIEKLTKIDTPTDDAMRQLYGEWDDLNDVTKKALIKQEAQEMRQRKIEAQQEEILNRIKLDEEIGSVIESNPKLSGKETEFRRFAANPKNKGISAEVLAKAFLFDVSEDTPAPQPNVQKTEVLPQGNGGPREPLKPKKISLTDAAQIRKTDYPRYLELVKSGMIDDEDID
ncbi:MAG TPA: hypothetical protein VF571_09190 [Pyrinomonadaceae bacterium]|jgi:hypothetical protein